MWYASGMAAKSVRLQAEVVEGLNAYKARLGPLASTYSGVVQLLMMAVGPDELLSLALASMRDTKGGES